MRKTRWSWYLLVSGIGVVSAEGLSWSTPVIFPVGLFVLLIYGLHYVLIVDYLATRRALTLRSLAVGGLVVGITTESLLTKVIWNPPWDEGDVTRVLGLGLFEVGFIVLVWHVWMSMAVPFALSLTYFGQAGIVGERGARWLLRALPLTMWMGAAIQSPDLIPLALIGIPLNAVGILLAARLYHRYARRQPLRDVSDMILTRGERRLVWGLVILLYALITPTRADAFPSAGPFVLGMALLAGSFWLLRAVARADSGRMPPPNTLRYSERGFVRYAVRFGLVSLVLVVAALILKPVSAGFMLVVILVSMPVGDGYLARLAWRLRRHQGHRLAPGVVGAVEEG